MSVETNVEETLVDAMKTAEGKAALTQESPEDLAAAFFSLEQPRLKVLVDEMSLRQVRRVLYNIVAYPIVKKEHMLNSEIEKKAFYLAEQMIMNKTIMALQAEMTKVDNAQKALADAGMNEDGTIIDNEPKEETNNG